MTAQVIDGKAFAATVRGKVATQVAVLTTDHAITPGLAVVLVGEDPASQVYVRSKGKQTLSGSSSDCACFWDLRGGYGKQFSFRHFIGGAEQGGCILLSFLNRT